VSRGFRETGKMVSRVFRGEREVCLNRTAAVQMTWIKIAAAPKAGSRKHEAHLCVRRLRRDSLARHDHRAAWRAGAHVPEARLGHCRRIARAVWYLRNCSALLVGPLLSRTDGS